MNMRTLLAAGLILVFYCGFGQTITVKDAETLEPLELVSIVSEEPRAFTMTDEEGKADVSDFRGSTLIEIQLLGYQSITTSYFKLEGSEFEVYLEPTMTKLEQVVISATRWNQPRRKVPARVTSILPREVALQNPQTAADLLGASGDIFIQRSQLGGGSPMIRGFSTNRLLYAVDGVRMNNAIFRSGNLQNVISLDPLAIERTEVIFGPGSVIYGSDAIGAVMSFQTLDPKFSDDGSVSISGKALGRYSSAANEATFHIDVNVGGQKWAAVTSVTSSDYGDLRMGRHGPDEYLRPFYVGRIDGADVIIDNQDPLVQVPTGYEQVNLMQKFRYKPNDNWDLRYAFHYSATSDVPRYDRHIRLKDGRPRNGQWAYGPQIWSMHHLHGEYRADNAFYDAMSLRLAYQRFEESRIDRDFGASDLRKRAEGVDAISVNLDLYKDISDRQTMYYGLEYVFNDVVSLGTVTNIESDEIRAGAARYPNANWASYGIYLNWQYQWTEPFLLQGGIRYNHFSVDADFSNNSAFFPLPFESASLNNGSVTGSFGFVWNPGPNWSVGGNVSSGFRAPNVDDIGKIFDSEPGSVVVPNDDIEAEFATNFELGITHVIDDIFKVDITGYYTLLNDALIRRDFRLGGMDSIIYDGVLSQVQAVQNAAKTRVYGIQAGLEWKLPGGFRLGSKINIQTGEDEGPDGVTTPSRHAAPWFGTTRLSYKSDGLDMQINAQYSGGFDFEDLPPSERGKPHIYAVDANGNPWSPSWYTLNFKVRYALSSDLTISGGVENLTDRRYRPYSSGLAGPGRNMILALKVEF